MKNDVDANNGGDHEEAADMDPQGAEQVMEEATTRARRGRELRVNLPALYVAWGLSVLFGYGVLWLSVRNQRPYQGPGASAFLALLLLLPISVSIRAGIVARAERGVSGRSVHQWTIFFLSLPLGSVALWIEADALSHAGVSRPVLSVMEFAAPMLVMGLVFFVSSAVSLDWSRLALGAWLLSTGAGGAWAGPETILAVYALAGGCGFLLMAALEPRLRRP